MNKKRLGRGLESLLGREEGGYDPVSVDANDLDANLLVGAGCSC